MLNLSRSVISCHQQLVVRLIVLLLFFRYDKEALHFLLRDSASLEPMGVIRFNPPPKRKLARLAVLPAYRRKGHADRLVQRVHDWVKADLKKNPLSGTEDHKAIVWLHAQLPVKAFYTK